jgi:hypothetical protein
MLETKLDITPEIVKALETALQNELSKEFDEAVKRFNDKKLEIISRILISIHKTVDIQTAGRSVIFTIREIEKPK